MFKTKILIILSIILLAQSSQIIYSGISNYYSDNYIYKSLVNEINALNIRNFNFDANFNQLCTPTTKKLLFYKNKSQIKPVNNTSTYNLQLKFNQISVLRFTYKNGVYQTSSTLPLKITRTILNYGASCNSLTTRTQTINILAKDIIFQKRLSNINGVLTPQIGFSVTFNLVSLSPLSTIDPQITQAITLLQNNLQGRVNQLFTQVQLPLVQRIGYQIFNKNYLLNLNLVNLPTSNPSNTNGNYISVLNGGLIQANSFEISDNRDLSTITPNYFTQFQTTDDAQFFISQTSFTQLYLAPSSTSLPVFGAFLNINSLKEIFPDILRYYPVNSQITAKFLTGVIQFDATQTFNIVGDATFVISINNFEILKIGITQNYKISTIQQATSTNKSTLIKMSVSSVKNNLNQLLCNCGSVVQPRLSSYINLSIIPWVNSNLTSVSYVIQNFFNANFRPQTAKISGNNIILSSNYTPI